LDGNHRLVGEGCYKLNLLVGERLDPDSPNRDDTNDRIFPQHRHGEDGPMHPRIVAMIVGPAILGIFQDIVNMDNATLQGGAPCRGASILTDWVAIYNFLDEFSRVAVVGRGTINISVLSVDQSPIGVAQAYCPFQQSFQHRFEIEGRATDDLE